MRLRLRYFASLRDAAGVENEWVEHDGDASMLYAALSTRYRFALPQARIRLAVNGALVPWMHDLQDGDEVVFLPPMSGG